jgi:hypothetical protein
MVDISATIITGLVALDIGYDIGTRRISLLKSFPLIFIASAIVASFVVLSYFQIQNVPADYPILVAMFSLMFFVFAYAGLVLGKLVSAAESKEPKRRRR